MSKQKTVLQNYIKWLEKQLSYCKPMAPAIPFITIAINKAKDALSTERQQVRNDAVEFAEWIRKQYQPKSNNRCWVSNKRQDSYPEYTTEQLYEQFRQK